MSSIKHCDGCGIKVESGCAELYLDSQRKKPAKGKTRGEYDHYSADLCAACFKVVFALLKTELEMKKVNGGIY